MKHVLSNSVRQIPHGSIAKQRTSASKWIELTIGVKRTKPLPSMDDLWKQRTDERKYVTHQVLEQECGPDAAAMKRIEATAKLHGLSILDVDKINSRIQLGGHVQDLSRAFGVTLYDYSHPTIGQFHARTGPIELPSTVDPGDITGVFGFNNHRILRRRRNTTQEIADASVSKSRRWFLPSELATIYNFPQNDCAGQCIGILEFGGGIVEADLEAYYQKLGINAPSLKTVTLNGVSLDPSSDDTVEVMLDIEVVAAMSPGASIVTYFSTFDEKGFVDALGAAVSDQANDPGVLSISWGWDENQPFNGSTPWSPAAIEHVNESFQTAALLGITVCVSTGDDGAEAQIQDGRAHVNFPATSPFVLAVGGTTLRAKGNNGTLSAVSEVVWNDGPGSGTGGGVSDLIGRPSWQPAVPPSINPGNFAGRAIPDVAANADPATGYFIRAGGRFTTVGGTSAAAPLWASLVARINAAKAKRVGNFNAQLYGTIGPQGVLRDVARGNNDTDGLLGGQFEAAPGWDACTGWGVPDGQALLAVL